MHFKNGVILNCLLYVCSKFIKGLAIHMSGNICEQSLNLGFNSSEIINGGRSKYGPMRWLNWELPVRRKNWIFTFFLSFVVLVVPEGEMTEGQCYRVTRNDKACDFWGKTEANPMHNCCLVGFKLSHNTYLLDGRIRMFDSKSDNDET